MIWKKKLVIPLELNVPDKVEEIGWDEADNMTLNAFLHNPTGTKMRKILESMVLESAFSNKPTDPRTDGFRAGIAQVLTFLRLNSRVDQGDSPTS